MLSTHIHGSDQETERIISTLVNHTRAVSSDSAVEIKTPLIWLLSRFEVVIQHEHHHIQELLVDRGDREYGGNRNALSKITAEIEMFDTSRDEENNLRHAVESTILSSLQYPMMSNRYEGIVEAHPKKTFYWAFRDSTDNQLPWSNLGNWLKRGHGVYLVNGKPGSGKSTLMKHIFNNTLTRTFLRF